MPFICVVCARLLVCSLFIRLYFCVPHFDSSLFEHFLSFHIWSEWVEYSTYSSWLDWIFFPFRSLFVLLPSHCHCMFCHLFLTLSNGMFSFVVRNVFVVVILYTHVSRLRTLSCLWCCCWCHSRCCCRRRRCLRSVSSPSRLLFMLQSCGMICLSSICLEWVQADGGLNLISKARHCIEYTINTLLFAIILGKVIVSWNWTIPIVEESIDTPLPLLLKINK